MMNGPIYVCGAEPGDVLQASTLHAADRQLSGLC